MLSFKQFNEAYVYNPSAMEFGFVTPQGKVIKAKKEPSHDVLAVKNGFPGGADEAVADGYWIRYVVGRKGTLLSFVSLNKIKNLVIKFVLNHPLISQTKQIDYDIYLPNNVDRILKVGRVNDPAFLGDEIL